MTRVSFYTDPACPWAWITSRWIVEVAHERDLDISWRSFSPEVRDGGVRMPAAIPAHLRALAQARRTVAGVALPVLEVVRSRYGEAAAGRFYTEFGLRLNEPDRPHEHPAPGLVGDALRAAALDAEAESAAAGAVWQSEVARSTHEAMEAVGRGATTPVIVLEDDSPVGMSGPILSTVPAGETALRLWDTFRFLAQNSSFLEVRRDRPVPTFPRLCDWLGMPARRSC